MGRDGTHWHVFRNDLIVSEIFSNRFRSSACAPYSFSRSSISETGESSGLPDFAMTRNVSASKTTASVARHRSRKKVRCEVMSPMLGIKVWMTDDHAWS